MKKIICVVGPTATGKTKKAIEIARSQPSIIISADSRQVYRGMDIVTGKDHPSDVPIFGLDILNPDEPCSVSVWYDAVSPHLKKAWEEGLQPIVVGGTGLYIKALVEGIETMQVPINQALRSELSDFTLQDLVDRLAVLSADKYDSMNESDQKNPRRLIRAIEILEASPARLVKTDRVAAEYIGLRFTDLSLYTKLIRARVESRIEQGAVKETQGLLREYPRELSSLSAIGYQSIIKHLSGEISYPEMIEDWVLGEVQYVKRQMTWFRKQPVIWYDIHNELDSNKEGSTTRVV